MRDDALLVDAGNYSLTTPDHVHQHCTVSEQSGLRSSMQLAAGAPLVAAAELKMLSYKPPCIRRAAPVVLTVRDDRTNCGIA
jgi:hypothetical protein